MQEGVGVLDEIQEKEVAEMPQEIYAIRKVWDKLEASLKKLEEDSVQEVNLEGITRHDIESMFNLQTSRDVTEEVDIASLNKGDGWERTIRISEPRYLHIDINPPISRKDEGFASLRYLDARNDPYDPREELMSEYTNNTEDVHMRINLLLLYPNNQGENTNENYTMTITTRSSQKLPEKHIVHSLVNESGKTMWRIEKPPKKNH